MSGWRRSTPAVAGLVVAVVVGGCAEPAIPEPDTVEESDDDPITSDALDPAADELAAAVVDLDATVAAARSQLRAAAEAADAAAARESAEAALALLLDDPDGVDRPDGLRPLFPAITSDRANPDDQDDALSATLTIARDAGGDAGRAAVETLRDPIAGDLGAWERDAEGVVDAARAATSVSGRLSSSLDDVAADVALLESDGVRALAWTFAAVDAGDLEDVQLAAERAAAHLSVVVIAVDLLAGPAPSNPNDPAEEDA